MPKYIQKNKATKGNMAAQKKGARPDYPDIDGDGNKTESMKQAAEDKKSNPKAAQQRGKINSMKVKAKVKASKNKSSASKKKGNPTSNISKASLILNPNKKVFKNIKTNNNYKFELEAERKTPEMAAPMKGYHPGKMSDTDMGIKERYGKQATSDALAAQQKGNPILKNIEKAKNATKPAEHHTSGLPKFITSAESGERFNTTTGGIDEGSFTKITTNIPERSKVTATEDSDKYQKGEEFYVDPAKMHAQHPSKQRMANMVNKVAQYKMPNVKAAQKKYCK